MCYICGMTYNTAEKRREYERQYRKTSEGRAKRTAQEMARRRRRRAEGSGKAHAYYLAHREELLAEAKAKRAASREKAAATKRRYNDGVRYKLTADQRAAMLAARGPACLCGSEAKPVVDHCHDTGFVRGLLCAKCNSALGYAKDNPATLRALATYVEQAAVARLFS